MNILEKLQNWYATQCDGNWEHENGLIIETLDNPGWSVKINIANTRLENSLFKSVHYGIDIELNPKTNDWLSCEVKNKQFEGYGGPHKLEKILTIFLAWAEIELQNNSSS